MADLKLECTNCGCLFNVSEYIDSPTVNCPQCSELLEISKVTLEIESGLRVCRDKSGSGQGGTNIEVPGALAPPPMSKKMKQQMEKNRKMEAKRKKDKKDPYQRNAPQAWHGWALLLLLGGVLVGLQHTGDGQNEWYYHIRLYLFPLIYLVVMVAAFKEGYLCGFLCLLLPPYLFYYAVSRTDVYYIRGAFVAMIISLSLEMYYNPERSFFAYVEQGINNVIEGGAGAIHRAGSSGVEFVD